MVGRDVRMLLHSTTEWRKWNLKKNGKKPKRGRC